MQLALLDSHELGGRHSAHPNLMKHSQIVRALDFLPLDAKEPHLGEEKADEEVHDAQRRRARGLHRQRLERGGEDGDKYGDQNLGGSADSRARDVDA